MTHQEPDPELAARLERDRREAIVRSIQDGLIVLDDEGTVVEVNARWSAMLGFPPEEALGRRPPFPWWPDEPAERAKLEEAVATVVHEGKTGEWDVSYRRRDGSRVQVILSATPLLHPATGARLGSVATIKDVTDRSRADAERERLLGQLSAETDRRSAFLAALQDGFLALSLDGTVEDVNQRFCEIVGLRRDELIGTTPPFPWAVPKDEVERDRLRRAFFDLERSQALEVTVELTRPDGSSVPVNVTLAPVFDEGGALTGAVSTIKEVGESLRAQLQTEALTRRLQALVTVSRALATGVTMEDVVDATIASLRASTDIDAIGVALVEGRRIRVIGSYGDDPMFTPGTTAKLNADDPLARAAASGEALVLHAEEAPGGSVDRVGDHILIPLRAHQRVVGLLGVAVSHRPIEDDDLELMDQVATRVATNLERARLFEAESVARSAADRARSRVERLQAATSELSRATDSDEVIRIVLHEAIGVVRAQTGGLALSDQDATALEMVAHEGATWNVGRFTVPVDAAFAFCDAFRTAATIVVPTWAGWEERYPEGAAMFRTTARSQVAVPILGEDRPLGVIALLFREEVTPSDEDLRMLAALAGQASVALERALATDRERASAERLARIQKVTAAVSAAKNPSEVADAVLHVGLPALDGVAGALYTVTADGSALHLVTQRGYPEAVMRELPEIPLDADLPIAEAVRSGEMVFLASQAEADLRYPGLPERRRRTGVTTNPGARVAMPLLAGGTTTGALVISFPGVRQLGDQDRQALLTIANLVSQALERARLYAAEHRVAQVLQESLLPQALRSVGPARVAARYLAAEEYASVGGDWFEIVDLPDDRIGIAVGDVVGNGIVAATAMGQLRSGVRALALAGKRPGEVLAALDDFAEATEGAVMSTAAYAEVDTRSGAVVYACAGHPPPLVVGSQPPRFLEGGRRTPLAVPPPASDHAIEASDLLQPGETVILYTDGLIERRGESLDAGLARLAEVAGRFSNRGPDMMAEHLVQALLPEGSTQDDVAVLCLRFEPADVVPPVDEGASPFDYGLRADARELSRLRTSIRGWLEAAGIGSEARDEIVLAIGEACANAIEHAGDTGSDRITVSLALDDGTVVATISDRGRWRSGTASDIRGRGLLLMEALMDAVEVTPRSDGTTVILRRSVRRVPRTVTPQRSG
ncbi:MAG TPA: SpoIIE family protein phosphatase [Actinomycetota bacterium]